MAKSINNYDDIIDSRDVIEALENLENEFEDWKENETAETVNDETNFPEYDELVSLRKFAEEGEGYGDWSSGETLIRDSYFTEYAEQLAEDIGAIDRNANWPKNHIDWDAAAEELKSDYTCISFDGIDYWMRS